jgi:hypothetical protein
MVIKTMNLAISPSGVHFYMGTFVGAGITSASTFSLAFLEADIRNLCLYAAFATPPQ